jgi:hypothetical protein
MLPAWTLLEMLADLRQERAAVEARPECLRSPVVRLPNLRLSRPHLRSALQALE